MFQGEYRFHYDHVDLVCTSGTVPICSTTCEACATATTISKPNELSHYQATWYGAAEQAGYIDQLCASETISKGKKLLKDFFQVQKP